MVITYGHHSNKTVRLIHYTVSGMSGTVNCLYFGLIFAVYSIEVHFIYKKNISPSKALRCEILNRLIKRKRMKKLTKRFH